VATHLSSGINPGATNDLAVAAGFIADVPTGH